MEVLYSEELIYIGETWAETATQDFQLWVVRYTPLFCGMAQHALSLSYRDIGKFCGFPVLKLFSLGYVLDSPST